MDRTFPSKVDRWLAVLLVFAVLMSIGVTVASAIAERKPWMIGFGLILPGIIWLVAIPIRYTLMQDGLLIQTGLLRKRIPYSSIISVEPTRNPISAPAFSLDRLMIRHKKGGIMISPNDKQAFLTDLAKRANLQRQGERLNR